MHDQAHVGMHCHHYQPISIIECKRIVKINTSEIFAASVASQASLRVGPVGEDYQKLVASTI